MGSYLVGHLIEDLEAEQEGGAAVYVQTGDWTELRLVKNVYTTSGKVIKDHNPDTDLEGDIIVIELEGK